MTLEDEIAGRLADVRGRMAAAAARGGRTPQDVRLVAVSKTWPADHVRAAARAGQVDFGENRVQEALPKIDACADLPLRWHLVGHLQANKSRKAARAFACIQSVDRLELLDALDRAATESETSPHLLVQVDLAGEDTKFGAPLEAVRGLMAAAARCRAARVVGLMVLPPFFDDPEGARPYFRALWDLRSRLLDEGTDPGLLRELSMGMSHDFEVAVEEGATIVRVGTAIFGQRGPAAGA